MNNLHPIFQKILTGMPNIPQPIPIDIKYQEEIEDGLIESWVAEIDRKGTGLENLLEIIQKDFKNNEVELHQESKDRIAEKLELYILFPVINAISDLTGKKWILTEKKERNN